MKTASLTSPLNLRQFLKLPDTRMDAVPFLDLMLIGLFFALFSSQLLLPPGLGIQLPLAGPNELEGRPVSAVITVLPESPGSERSMVLFRGEILPLQELASQLTRFLSDRDFEEPVLLVKFDRGANMAQLLQVARAARSAGFSAVQVAAEEEQRNPYLFDAPVP